MNLKNNVSKTSETSILAHEYSKSTIQNRQIANTRFKDASQIHAAYYMKFSKNLILIIASSTKQTFGLQEG